MYAIMLVKMCTTHCFACCLLYHDEHSLLGSRLMRMIQERKKENIVASVCEKYRAQEREERREKERGETSTARLLGHIPTQSRREDDSASFLSTTFLPLIACIARTRHVIFEHRFSNARLQSYKGDDTKCRAERHMDI